MSLRAGRTLELDRDLLPRGPKTQLDGPELRPLRIFPDSDE